MAIAESPQTTTANSSGVKSPHARLLDLLAGWSDYVDADEYRDAPGIAEAIADLYQEAGTLGLEAGNPVDENSPDVLRDFLLDRVLPLLTR